MDTRELNQYMDQQRWLMNNGLISDGVKNQLFFCGSIVHKDVQAVELKLDPESKVVEYTIYVERPLLKLINRYHELSTAKTLFGMWRFKRLLKKEGSLDFRQMLGKFVSDFLGPTWSTQVTVKDLNEYVDSLGDQGGLDDSSGRTDKLPDSK